MLSVLIILVYIFLLSLNNSIKDRFSCYLYTFIVSWHFFIFLLSSFDPLGFYPVSLYAYSLSILSIVFFSIGFVSFRIDFAEISKIGKISSRKTFKLFVSENAKYKVVLIFLCICMLYFTNKYMSLLSNNTAIESRLIRYNISFFGNSVWVGLFYNIILTSFFYFSVFVVSGYLFVKKNTFVFILTLLYVLMYSFVGSGREPVFFLLFNLLFCMFLFKTIKCESVFASKIISFNYKFVLSVFVLVVGLLLFLSGLRENVDVWSLETIYKVSESLLRTILAYLLGPIRAFDYIIHSNYYLDKLGYPWYGLAVFSGLNEYLYLFLRFFGLDIGVSSSRIIGYVQEMQLTVSPDILYFNYTFTAFLTCYLDYGILSVILYPLIGGILFRYAISELYRCATFPLLAMICYLFYMSIFSFATLVLVQTTPWFYLLFLFFLHKSKM